MLSEREKMLDGQLYNAEDLELKRMRIEAKKISKQYNELVYEEPEKANKLLAQMFKSSGSNIYAEPDIFIDYGKNTVIGNNFYANTGLVILDVAEVNIGNDVLIGPRVSIMTAGHPIDATVRNQGLEFGKKITIKNNVWIGGNVVINPGVIIGDNVVIGSGSVVVKNIPDNTIAVGNPAHVIKTINQL
ncbi:sugar O-acetyltransferase [Leuconostoc gasicomitatum]|uniref:sugar O-acetyltransferase n=1 Tax=Leuconostoc gasicomitatum TaxID=115778 RepID=UPI0007E29C95|nr:sugar O-acetyltransferase [Leuconostoc gasicomitatum]CUW06115.1 galactoside O-acetyltransferase [Leuconostoc gasicomitatum]